MSVAPFKPDPLTIPDVAFVDVPQCFWDELIAYRAPSLQALALKARDQINRQTLDAAATELRRDLTIKRIETRGLAFALRKASDRAKDYKRYYVDCATDKRNYEKTTRRRVSCGARKKDGAQCRAMTEPGRNRCRFHGGRSTGPRTLDGMRRALSCLPQYRDNPDRLAVKLAEFSDNDMRRV